MKFFFLVLLILLLAGTVWFYLGPPARGGVETSMVLEEPGPLPEPRLVNEKVDVIVANGQPYYDVTVRSVLPDAVTILHESGVTSLPMDALNPALQRRLGYEPEAAEAYRSLKLAHSMYQARKAARAARVAEQAEKKGDGAEETLFHRIAAMTKRAIGSPTPTPTPQPEPEPTPAAPPTPEEQFEALLERPSMEAVELAELVDRHPAVAARILKNRRVVVAGEIRNLWVRGMDGTDLDVELRGSGSRDVCFSSDYRRYFRQETTGGMFAHKLVKEGRKVLLYLRDRFPERNSSRIRRREAFDRILYTEGDRTTLEGIVERVGTGDIHVHWSKGIPDVQSR